MVICRLRTPDMQVCKISLY